MDESSAYEDLEELARRGERLEVELGEWLADCDRVRLGLPNIFTYAHAAMRGVPDLIRAKARARAEQGYSSRSLP